MPHKRAKRIVREQQRFAKSVMLVARQNTQLNLSIDRGNDLAPGKQSLQNEAVPKSMARALNAMKVREEWKKRKREEGLGTEDEKGSKKRKKMREEGGTSSQATVSVARKKTSREKGQSIQPGETLQQFNKYAVLLIHPMT
jgi:hypothetical protein